MICSTCSRPIQRGQSSTSWWEEKNGKHYYRVAHVECPSGAHDLGACADGMPACDACTAYYASNEGRLACSLCGHVHGAGPCWKGGCDPCSCDGVEA